LLIKVEHLSKIYPVDKASFTALDNISFSIEKGEMLAVMGPSGSGKSTLMNLIGCLDRPTSGEIYFEDQKISSLDDSQLAVIRNKKIGFVFQVFNLLPRQSALKNVELPLIYANVSATSREKIAREVLEATGLGPWLQHGPPQLSGGQRQRVAIARALVNKPDLLLADEPTGNLDTVSGGEIMKIFQKLNTEGMTVVVVTHNPDIANLCRRMVRIIDGRIIEDKEIK
jgi:putative ABC transport system ATP-binding protein